MASPRRGFLGRDRLHETGPRGESLEIKKPRVLFSGVAGLLSASYIMRMEKF